MKREASPRDSSCSYLSPHGGLEVHPPQQEAPLAVVLVPVELHQQRLLVVGEPSLLCKRGSALDAVVGAVGLGRRRQDQGAS